MLGTALSFIAKIFTINKQFNILIPDYSSIITQPHRRPWQKSTLTTLSTFLNIDNHQNIRGGRFEKVRRSLQAAVGRQITIHFDETILPAASKCANMIDFKASTESIAKRIDQRAQTDAFYKKLSSPNRQLEGVNFGSGTSGTTFVHDVLSGNYFGNKAAHYNTPTAEAIKLILHCIDRKYSQTSRCLSANVLEKLARYTRESIEKYNLISDSPMSHLFVDILLAVRDISGIVTLREIDEFTRRRYDLHKEAICKPQLWQHPKVLHPFDWTACLQVNPRGFVADALITTPILVSSTPQKPAMDPKRCNVSAHAGLKKLRDAYQRTYTVNYIAALSRGVQVLPICLADYERGEAADIIDRTFRNATSHTFFPSLSNLKETWRYMGY